MSKLIPAEKIYAALVKAVDCIDCPFCPLMKKCLKVLSGKEVQGLVWMSKRRQLKAMRVSPEDCQRRKINHFFGGK